MLEGQTNQNRTLLERTWNNEFKPQRKSYKESERKKHNPICRVQRGSRFEMPERHQSLRNSGLFPPNWKPVWAKYLGPMRDTSELNAVN